MIQSEKQAILISKKGFKELKKQINDLEHARSKAINQLRELDKSHVREDRLERIEKIAWLDSIESQLVDKKNILSRAKLISASKRARIKVAIGSVVDLIDQQGKIFRYTIVNSVEANPSDGRISIQSPLGSLLLGKSTRDMIKLNQGDRTRSWRLVAIS